jgi:hypothetical protein
MRFGQSPEDVFVAQIDVRNDDKLVVSGHGVVAVNHHFMNFTCKLVAGRPRRCT